MTKDNIICPGGENEQIKDNFRINWSVYMYSLMDSLMDSTQDILQRWSSELKSSPYFSPLSSYNKITQ